MKPTYLLANYDNVVREIKNPNTVIAPELLTFFEEIPFENYFLYKVSFRKINGETSYVLHKPIPNLHPNANDFLESNWSKTHQLKCFIDQIESELNIQNDRREYFWTTVNDDVTLYIKNSTGNVTLTEDIRFFNYCYNTLKDENEIIINTIKIKISDSRSQKTIGQYVKKKHHSIRNFIAGLVKRINPNTVTDLYDISENYDRIDCLKMVFVFAEHLSFFLEKQYTKYLHSESKLSYKMLFATQHEYTSKIEFIKNGLQTSTANPRLIDIALKPISKFENVIYNNPLTRSEFCYCTNYITKFFIALKNKADEVTTDDLEEWLQLINLNILPLFGYLIDTINLELDQQENNTLKLETLFRFSKKLNQKPNLDADPLKRDLPSIRQQLNNWMEEEIEYYRKKITLENHIPFGNSSDIKIKMLSGLSVAQLSYFSGLLLQSGIIKHQNQSEVFRFMSENFKTPMTDQISTDSFRSKYYNVEMATKNVVREKIIDLLNLTKL